MKNIIIIFISCLLFNCITKRTFNKAFDKGISKGWIDTTTKKIDQTFDNKIDTPKIQIKEREVIKIVLNDTTIYKDTCYDKKGKVIGRLIDKSKLENKLEKQLTDSLLPIFIRCLQKPIFLEKDGMFIEVSQDSSGRFKINAEYKDITINRPSNETWYHKYILDVWFYLVIIGILLLVIFIRK